MLPISAHDVAHTFAAAPPPSITTLDGATIGGAIVGWDVAASNGLTPHSWTADANGLFHTATDLKAEWQGLYARLLDPAMQASLSPWQRLEANAEAVFENTGLNDLSSTVQARDREDAQREIDAIAAGMKIDQTAYGIDPNQEFDVRTYIQLEHTVQGSETLEELAVQGHGLNSPPAVRYAGYTNDFQNNVDNTTKYVGGGSDNGEKALTDLVDDDIMTHVPFPTVAQNNHLEQLNQNGADEDVTAFSVAGMNQSIYERIYVASDFSRNAAAVGGVVTLAAVPLAPTPVVAGAGQITTLTGAVVASTITGWNTDPVHGLTPHSWTADAGGQFHTSANLQQEWQGLYQQMLRGQGASLTAWQRLEGNAEAFFENTGLSKLSAPVQARDREDAQREIDAIAAGMRIDQTTLGTDPNAAFTTTRYVQLEHAMQFNDTLAELGIQGHGLTKPTSATYNGFTNDFQGGVDGGTRYVGGGVDTGDNALGAVFDRDILTHTAFASVIRNGQLEQLNENGSNEGPLAATIAGMNQAMFSRVYVAADFSRDATVQGPQILVSTNPATQAILTLSGTTIAGTIPGTDTDPAHGVTAHTWVADDNGLFHTATNLAAEWQRYYADMRTSNAESLTLTSEQRLEGNAEAVFENTGLAQLSPAQQAVDREDAQRDFDALGAAMSIDAAKLGISASAAFTAQSYQQMQATLQQNATLEELAVQGHGLDRPPAARYGGYLADFKTNVDTATLYVGGGVANAMNAVAAFFDDDILSDAAFPTVMRNGAWVQLNQNGDAVLSMANAIKALNASMFTRVYQSADFKLPAPPATPATTTATARAK